jgi:hypothetical protein
MDVPAYGRREGVLGIKLREHISNEFHQLSDLGAPGRSLRVRVPKHGGCRHRRQQLSDLEPKRKHQFAVVVAVFELAIAFLD